MQFTPEHEQIADTVRKFVANEINPYTAQWEKAGIFPARELFKKMGDLGLLGIKYPTEFGGMGLDFSYSMVMAEALGDCNVGGVPMAIGVQTDMCTPALARFGSDELRKAFLAPAIAGDMVGCIGVSEVSGGSDVAALKTTAKKDGGDYVINGSKMWITNGMQADWCCLLANTSDGPVHKNKSLILVPMDAPGITRQKIEKIGMHSSDTGHLFFDNLRVPRRNLIGQEGHGFMYQMQQFQEERLWAAASHWGGLQQLIRQTIEYAQQRQMFGGYLSDMPWFQFKMGELATEVQALRCMLYHACEEYVAGRDVLELATMCKLKAGRASREVADTCLQFWGGMGFTWDNPISRAYRDGRLGSIGGGADEVMLGILTKTLGIARKGRG